jgi:hypothetical protein
MDHCFLPLARPAPPRRLCSVPSSSSTASRSSPVSRSGRCSGTPRRLTIDDVQLNDTRQAIFNHLWLGAYVVAGIAFV